VRELPAPIPISLQRRASKPVSILHGPIRAIGWATMFENDIRIRIADEEMTFVYSIWRAGALIETAEVCAAEEVVPGFYGGSEVMD
jgi:hypothetical protein